MSHWPHVRPPGPGVTFTPSERKRRRWPVYVAAAVVGAFVGMALWTLWLLAGPSVPWGA